MPHDIHKETVWNSNTHPVVAGIEADPIDPQIRGMVADAIRRIWESLIRDGELWLTIFTAAL